MPLALAGLAMVAGTGLQIAGGEKSREAMAATRRQFAAKEAESQREGNEVYQGNLAKNTSDAVAADAKAGTAARTTAFDDLNRATTPIATALPAVSDASSPAGRAQASAGTAADAWSKLVTGAQNKLAGYGDVQSQLGRQNADTSQRLGVVNDFAQGNARLMPLEMEVAAHKGDKLSGWGSIVSSIGSLIGLGAATGAFSSAATAAATPAQMAALGAGMGPVTAGSAAAMAPATLAAGNAAWAGAGAADLAGSRLLNPISSFWSGIYE